MKESTQITENTRDFLAFMKERFPLIHMSNLFFRDVHYGAMAYLESKGRKLKYLDGEAVAREVVADLEQKGIFRRIDHQSFLLNYPEFALPRPEPKPEPKAAAKPELKTEQKAS